MRRRLKDLSTGVAIYGAGDAAIQIVNFGLLAVYVKGGFLTNVDYGALALIGAMEAFAKIVSRWGLDGAFMRYFHERGPAFPRFASTIVWFLLGANVVVFGAALAAADPVGRRVFDDPGYITALRVMLVNTFAIALTFVPFHALRLTGQSITYSALTFARSVGTLLLRIVLVIGLGYGLAGIYWADLIVTMLLVPWLWRWLRPYVAWTFSASDLRAALRFGLPRVPHGLAQQVLDGGNKLLLGGFITQAQLGVYQNATTLGTGVKFFTSAFETAWAPFYYATARDADAKTVFAKMTTYGLAVLVLLVAGTTATAEDIVRLMLTPEYLPAVPVLPIVAAGLGLHGVYLLTSIGLNLTSRTEFYPVATFFAAGVGLGLGAWLMPQYGALGAAVAFLASYGTLAAVAYGFARRLYPIAYEWSRLLRIVIAGIVAVLAARLVGRPAGAAVSFLLHGLVTVVVYAVLLALTGFFRASERALVAQLVARARGRRGRTRSGVS